MSQARWSGLPLLLVVLAAVPARATVYLSDFAGSMQGWTPQWHKESPTGSNGVVSLVNDRGYLDSWSLKFDMGDGFGDDGTLWVEKAFPVPAGVSTPVKLDFELYSPFQSDFNNFQVKAFIGDRSPEVQADFTTIGATDTQEGWVPYSHEETVLSNQGIAWVAVGVRVSWEGHRDYWADHIQVTAVPEPASASLLLLAAALLAQRRMHR